jgi:hypothetical protein
MEAFSSQVFCISDQLYFTQQCEQALANGSLDKLLDDMRGRLTTYTTPTPDRTALTNLKCQVCTRVVLCSPLKLPVCPQLKTV